MLKSKKSASCCRFLAGHRELISVTVAMRPVWGAVSLVQERGKCVSLNPPVDFTLFGLMVSILALNAKVLSSNPTIHKYFLPSLSKRSERRGGYRSSINIFSAENSAETFISH